MVGTSSGTAPYSRSRTDSEAACSLVRGTSTRQPNSGLVSNHDRVSRRFTTSPTTVTAGGLIFAALASAEIESSVEITVDWSVVVPTRVIATGV
jgi:hypothetical protein